MPTLDTRGIFYVTGGGPDIEFDTSPFLDTEASVVPLRFDTLIVSGTTTLGDFFRWDRFDFIDYISPFLPSVATANTIIVTHLRFFGQPKVLEAMQSANVIRVEGFGIVENGGVRESFRFQNADVTSWSDNRNDTSPGPDLSIEILELGYSGPPLQVLNGEKQVGKRKAKTVA